MTTASSLLRLRQLGQKASTRSATRLATTWTIVGADSAIHAGDGEYFVTVGPGTTELFATRDQDVRSNRLTVCVGAAADCPDAHGRTIIGSERGDSLAGTRGDDAISGRKGRDRIVIRQGGTDRVNCGGASDVVIVRRGDRSDRIAGNCERVLRK